MQSRLKRTSRVSLLNIIASCMVAILLANSCLPAVASAPPVSHAIGVAVRKPSNPAQTSSASETAAKIHAQSVTPTLPSNPTDLEIENYRVFAEPLTPMVAPTMAGENESLSRALSAFKTRTDAEDFSSLQNFLKEMPDSRWNAALQLNLGLLQRESGYISEALVSLQAAWQKSKDQTGQKQILVAQSAVSELVFLQGMLGRVDAVKTALAEIGKRQMQGSANGRVDAAREAVQAMEKAPQRTFRCGPLALELLLGLSGKPVDREKFVKATPSTSNGTNAAQIKQWAIEHRLKLQVAKRSPGAEVVVPSIIHWSADHYGAIIKTDGGKYLVEDSTFDRNGHLWISKKAIDAESDGYFLVADGSLPAGWQPVSDSEAKEVWGKGLMQGRDEGKSPSTPNSCMGTNCGGCDGMAVASAWSMQAELRIQDTPLTVQARSLTPISH